jgi:hypothetical protein
VPVAERPFIDGIKADIRMGAVKGLDALKHKIDGSNAAETQENAI